MSNLTHIDENGNARMVDVSDKDMTEREAKATGTITLSKEAYDAIADKTIKKGDVLTVAQIAGIQGCKQTSTLIPLCHGIALTKAEVDFTMDPDTCSITATCTVKCTGKTGVEMEALTGVNIALLTIYDMVKAVDKRMVMSDIHLLTKSGGKSGDFSFE